MAEKPSSELAELLWEWMGRQRPVYNPHKLAQLLGVSPQTVYNWLNGTRPELSLLMTVASKTGITYKRLAAAAGYPTDPDPDEVLDRLLHALDERTDFDEEERAKVRRFIEDLRSRQASESERPRDAVAC